MGEEGVGSVGWKPPKHWFTESGFRYRHNSRGFEPQGYLSGDGRRGVQPKTAGSYEAKEEGVEGARFSSPWARRRNCYTSHRIPTYVVAQERHESVDENSPGSEGI